MVLKARTFTHTKNSNSLPYSLTRLCSSWTDYFVVVSETNFTLKQHICLSVRVYYKRSEVWSRNRKSPRFSGAWLTASSQCCVKCWAFTYLHQSRRASRRLTSPHVTSRRSFSHLSKRTAVYPVVKEHTVYLSVAEPGSWIRLNGSVEECKPAWGII